MDNENPYASRINHTNNSSVFLADPTYDGTDEFIVTNDTFGDAFETTVYTIEQDEAGRIFADFSSYEPRAKIRRL